ncbi:MAG: THUMP domain-containing protein [Gammaproteobacteria bacterium]|nr:THUMP domain-containing protein [Gammaproteobacteria bacterium]
MTIFFATCPKNLEGLLEEELIKLGATNTKQTVAGVNFQGTLETAYRICLWSRIANRILYPIKVINVNSAEDLYKGVHSIDWLSHMQSDASLLVDFAGTSQAINNSHFGALKVKDAIVDQIREKTGNRPEIDKENPKLRVNAYLHNDRVTISIDLSGNSLHL